MSTCALRVVPVGDSALLLEFENRNDPMVNDGVHAVAAALGRRAIPGLGEAVPAYRSLLVHYDPLKLSFDAVSDLVREALGADNAAEHRTPRVVELPTCYGGEYGQDLEVVAERAGLSVSEVIRLHAGADYRVYMLGFTPGFAYLGGLPPSLATPRLATPRTSVPAGSVGIAGEQTGIYPIASPGGWQLIGRTPMRLFDPCRQPPTLLCPGDRVRFVPVLPEEYERLHAEQWASVGTAPPRAAPNSQPVFEVLESGPLTTVQDLGRAGYEGLGVPVAGAMDPFAHAASNRLVGNAPSAAALEITAGGLVLRALSDCLVAVGGADLGLRINGWAIPRWMSAYVRRGWTVELLDGRAGFRATLAVAGGIAVPEVLGSRSTYAPGAFGGHEGRHLRRGDILYSFPTSLHLPDRAGKSLPPTIAPPEYSDSPTVDVVLGPQAEAFGDEAMAAFLGSEFAVTGASNRMGYRLTGRALIHRGSANILSDGIVMGAIQVPADQQPILMMADRQTTGGYPKIAVVARADLPLLAQLAPGVGRVKFRAVSVQEAQRKYRDVMQGLAGWFW